MKLASYPGAGALWSLGQTPAGINVSAAAMTLARDVGGVAEQEFLITVENPGHYELEFVYKRPWESTARQRHKVEIIAA